MSPHELADALRVLAFNYQEQTNKDLTRTTHKIHYDRGVAFGINKAAELLEKAVTQTSGRAPKPFDFKL